MTNLKTLTTLGITLALAAPLAIAADGVFTTANGEAVSRVVDPVVGQRIARVTPDTAPPLRIGSLSRDRQYTYFGDEGGWQLRPMEYRFEGGRLVHVDDPSGHMSRLADTSPETAVQRAARANSSGS